MATLEGYVEVPVADFVREVRILLDEQGENDAEFSAGQDESEVDRLVRAHIHDALLYVYENAAPERLSATRMVANLDPAQNAAFVAQGRHPVGAYYAGQTTGYDTSVSPPALTVKDPGERVEPMRLLSFRLASWPYAVRETLDSTSADAARMSHPNTRGTWERPAVTKSPVSWSANLYGPRDASDYATVYFVPRPSPVGEETTAFPCMTKLRRAVAYYTAALTKMVLQDGHADALVAQAMTEMGRTDALSKASGQG